MTGLTPTKPLGVRPHEMFPGASCELIDSLWDDYDAADGTVGQPVVLAALLSEAAGRLEREYEQAATDGAFEELVRYRQPDGSLTVSTVEELEVASAEAAEASAGKSVAELLELAARADYLADRVYGKHVETDDEVRRIELLHRQAPVYRAAAAR